MLFSQKKQVYSLNIDGTGRRIIARHSQPRSVCLPSAQVTDDAASGILSDDDDNGALADDAASALADDDATDEHSWYWKVHHGWWKNHSVGGDDDAPSPQPTQVLGGAIDADDEFVGAPPTPRPNTFSIGPQPTKAPSNSAGSKTKAPTTVDLHPKPTVSTGLHPKPTSGATSTSQTTPAPHPKPTTDSVVTPAPHPSPTAKVTPPAL